MPMLTDEEAELYESGYKAGISKAKHDAKYALQELLEIANDVEDFFANTAAGQTTTGSQWRFKLRIAIKKAVPNTRIERER